LWFTIRNPAGLALAGGLAAAIDAPSRATTAATERSFQRRRMPDPFSRRLVPAAIVDGATRPVQAVQRPFTGGFRTAGPPGAAAVAATGYPACGRQADGEEAPVRVGVLGATGRMGQATCRAVLAAPDLELAAVVARATGVGRPLRDLVPEAPEGLVVGESLSELLAAEAEVVVDFSRPEGTAAAVESLLPEGVHLVSGTTGLPAQLMDDLAALAGKADHGNAIWAPNFALGAVLAMHFAAVAGRFYPAAEVIELHHQAKADAPSGTALRTARAIAAARQQPGGPAGGGNESVVGARGGEVDGVRVHSVRLPGLVAHQEVLFGGQGEVLTIRHDSLDRSSFMPGVLLAIQAVAARPGLTVGLEPLLGLA
jgi:4-hydroxy-tetrahydrodipicolinate reductase